MTYDSDNLRAEHLQRADLHRRMGVPESLIERDLFERLEDAEGGRNDLGRLSAKVSDLSIENADLETQANKLEEQLKKARVKRGEDPAFFVSSSEEVDELVDQVARLCKAESDRSTACDRADTLSDENAGLKYDIDELRREIEQLRSDAAVEAVEAVVINVGNVNVDILREQLSAMTAERDKLSTELAFVRAERDRFLLASAMGGPAKRGRKGKAS